MAVSELIAQKREDLRESSTRENRRKGNIPGVYYYKGNPGITIYLKDTALNPLVFTSEVKTINLKIEGSDDIHRCILKDVQFDPVTDRPIHFDLLGISEHEEIKIEVPVQIIGSAIGVKDGGILQHSVHKLEIECLPKYIPTHIEVDVTELGIGDSIRVSDIAAVNFTILDTPEVAVVSVVPPTVEKVEEAPAAEGEAAPETAEPEVIGKGKKEEEEEEKKS
jgi:large subunit ribosomal protein L25